MPTNAAQARNSTGSRSASRGAAQITTGVTFEQMLACTVEGRVCPEKSRYFDDGRWSEALDEMMRIINLQRARGDK